MKGTFWVFCLVLTNITYSQNSLKNYYDNVLLAENYIVQEKFDSAVYHYDIAFENKKHPFDCDVENALFSISRLPNFSVEKSKSYIELLSYQISKDHLKKLNIDTNLTTYSINMIDEKTRMIVYDSINQMIKIDQEARKSSKIGEEYWNNLDIIDSQNIRRFKELLKQYDLLDDRLILYNKYDISLLFNHWLGDKDFRQYIYPLMLKAVKNGKMDARYYSEIVDYFNYRSNATYSPDYDTMSLKIYFTNNNKLLLDSVYNGYISSVKSSKSYFAYFDFSDRGSQNNIINNINQNRSAIYLGDILKYMATTLKLYIYRLSNSDFVEIINSRSIYISGFEPNMDLLKDKIAKNENLIYYIQSSHDFNIE